MSLLKKKQTDISQVPNSVSWNKRVLVVDDEPEIVSVYKDILAPEQQKSKIQSSRNVIAMPQAQTNDKFNFELVTANSAREALLHIERMKADGENLALGIFDVRLGEGMDGIELAREVLKSFPDMYAVFVTAYNDRSIDSISETLGAHRVDRWDYINKPFNASEITQKTRNFVSLWNLQKEKERHEQVMAELNRRVLESERVTSVAAVARGVAHEFGNLLMQIMGKAEVSRNKTPDEMKAALDKIIDASQRAHEILDRFNHLSDTKSQATMKRMVQVDEIIHEAIDLMSHQFKSASIKITITKLDKVKAYLHGTSLLQVLVNLFINAIHAMQKSGQIDVSLTAVSESDFEIRVRDYGPGIPEDMLEKVLEPFFTTKGDKGTGLGLAISREIIEIDHGGEFKLQNHSVKGLEIIMRMPVDVRATLAGGQNEAV